jgi:hypothetical protein
MPVSVIVLRKCLGFLVAVCKLSRSCLAEMHPPRSQAVILTSISMNKSGRVDPSTLAIRMRLHAS